MGNNPADPHLVSLGAHIPGKCHLPSTWLHLPGDLSPLGIPRQSCRCSNEKRSFYGRSFMIISEGRHWIVLFWIHVSIWLLHGNSHNRSQGLTHCLIPVAWSLVSKNPLPARLPRQEPCFLLFTPLCGLVLNPGRRVAHAWSMKCGRSETSWLLSLVHRYAFSFYPVLLEPSCHPPRKLWRHPCEEELWKLSSSPC